MRDSKTILMAGLLLLVVSSGCAMIPGSNPNSNSSDLNSDSGSADYYTKNGDAFLETRMATNHQIGLLEESDSFRMKLKHKEIVEGEKKISYTLQFKVHPKNQQDYTGSYSKMGGLSAEYYYHQRFDGVEYIQITKKNNVTYNTERKATSERLTGWEFMKLNQVSNLKITGTKKFNGDHVTVYKNEGKEDFYTEYRVKDYSLTMYVGDNGIIRKYSASYTVVTQSGKTVKISHDVIITGIDNTTVTAPDWIEEAKARTN